MLWEHDPSKKEMKWNVYSVNNRKEMKEITWMYSMLWLFEVLILVCTSRMKLNLYSIDNGKDM